MNIKYLINDKMELSNYFNESEMNAIDEIRKSYQIMRGENVPSYT